MAYFDCFYLVLVQYSLGSYYVMVVLFDEFIYMIPPRLVSLLPQWPERGQEPFTQCLRASIQKTRTHGFFVALFEKLRCAGIKDRKPVIQTG